MIPLDILKQLVHLKVVNLELVLSSPRGCDQLCFVFVKSQALSTHERPVDSSNRPLSSNVMDDYIHIPSSSYTHILISRHESSTKYSIRVGIVLCVERI